MQIKFSTKRMASGALAVIMLLGNAVPAFSDMSAYAANGSHATAYEQGMESVPVEEGYINDTPIRLQISKIKTPEGSHEGITPDNTTASQINTITYKISGRIDGSEAEIIKKYGSDTVELAYSSAGIYLGYGWQRGTLEYLLNRKEQNLNEELQIIYNAYGVFDGFAYATRKLETADDTNKYVAGATMALYDAVKISRNPEITHDQQHYGEDERFLGVTVVRDSGSSNVTSAYVNKGYAGTQIQYVLQKNENDKILIDAYGTIINDNYTYQDEINDEGNGTWIAQSVQREDTPVLFYSLDNLQITSNDVYTNTSHENKKKIDEVFGAERFDKDSRLYGFSKDGGIADATQTDETDFSIYAFESGSSTPVYEFSGGSYDDIHYSMPEKLIEVGEGTLMYHLDQNGNRDSLVDPQTGIAYIENRDSKEEVYVWPVNVFYDGSGSNPGSKTGSPSFRKIMTTRIATINSDTPDEYTIGSYSPEGLKKRVNPVLDRYGHPVYYRQSDQTYEKGEDSYDYDGDEYIGYIYRDSLDKENEDAYIINDHESLYNGDLDDPFDQSTHYQYTEKQTVRVTLDTAGNFIAGGSKSVPVPSRNGYVFAGWLMEPNQLTDKGSVKAYWRNLNSSGISEAEKQKWYSDRDPEGAVAILQITFDANGGEFKSGSGDIHSTDNILYHKLGEAYLIENLWLSGENTPNDPFDECTIDTVENIAAGQDTISGTGQSGNDVYSSTSAGGQADMLKRVNTGNYIMEELKTPMGYIKGIPVGITVEESENIQTAELIDPTIKVEFIKKDAADSFKKELYIDGKLQEDAAGTKLSVNEPQGGYTFKHVNGAVLSLKAQNKQTEEMFSDWVKITQNDRINKKNDNGVYYFEFQTDSPLFLEGIPAGNYVISEVQTPPGYVTMPDKEIVIATEEGVQSYVMNDDHTKVEVEKYYNDNGKKKNLPNSYRAELSLVDSNGAAVSTWFTDDIGDYTNEIINNSKKSIWQSIQDRFRGQKVEMSFVGLFTDKINGGDLNFTEISWNVMRKAEKVSTSTGQKEIWAVSNGDRYICENQMPPESAPQAFKDAYLGRSLEENTFYYQETLSAEKEELQSRTLADQIWSVSNGSKIHISVMGDNSQGENGRQVYIVDFKFNYQNEHTASDPHTISYDTIDGVHRFDYLPVGSYTVRETKTPEGFVTAGDKVIIVKETDDIQRFMLENKKKQFQISKTAQKGESYYTGDEEHSIVESPDPKKAAVIAGAKLSLYYSEKQVSDYETIFKNGKIPEGVNLVDNWISGNDGLYTEEEYLAELIRKDQIGDYKPHTVSNITNGWYYLVETETPSYYKTIAVKEIPVTDYSSSEELTEIQAVNTPIPLEVAVQKKDEEGNSLSSAVFTVKNKTLGGIEIGSIITDETGRGLLTIADIGRFAEDGKLEPYTFTIQEIVAPDGYQLNSTVHEFKASSDYHGLTTIMVNESDSDISDGVLHVVDKPTELYISKASFQDKHPVPGTTLAIYEATQTNGRWESTGVTLNPDWRWTTTDIEKDHPIKGLSASGTYVIVEEAIPEGYSKAEDIFFRVSANGLAIDKIWYDPAEVISISFHADHTDAVDQVTFSTKKLAGTYVTLTDLTNGAETCKGVLTGGDIYLSSKDIQEGKHYRIKEYVKYSDGSADCISTTTFIAQLSEDWMKICLNKEPKDLSVNITAESGEEIISFIPDETGSYTVSNPVLEDVNHLTVVGSILQKKGMDHKAVNPGDQIRYQISYEGSGKEIVVRPATGLTYLHTDKFEVSPDGSYRIVTEKEKGTFTFIARVNPDTSGYINQCVSIDGKQYSYLTPIAINHGDGIFKDSSKLVISSAVEGTHMDNEYAAFTFRVTLTKSDGSPLTGAYDYRTKYTNGRLEAYGDKRSFEIIVNGNDFITIHDLPYGTSYSVVQIVPSNYQFTVTNTEASGKTSNTEVSNVLFTNTRNESSERTLFKKDKGYLLSENLIFADESMLPLNKYGFSFGEKCQLNQITVVNKPTEVWFSKTDWTNSKEIPGAHCSLMDKEGNLITDAMGNPVEWISTDETKKLNGVLEKGKTYRYHEEMAPEGFGYSEDIVFTVSEDGTIDKVVMQDKPITAYFSKTDFAGTEIPGASCELRKDNASEFPTIIESWVSGTTPHKIQGKLVPGEIYYYHESAAPGGYSYSADIRFGVSKTGLIIDAYYVDENGQKLLHNVNGATDIVIIEQEDGTKTYQRGDSVVTLNGHGDAIDETGRIVAEKVKERIPIIDNVIQMKDKTFRTVFSKEDFRGNNVEGATCFLEKVNMDGSTLQVDKWVSGEQPHQLKQKIYADSIYRYYEEIAAAGYGYSEAIEFSIDRIGTVVGAHYVNSDGKPVLYDKGGYPTGIVVEADGSYSKSGVTIIINEAGDAVDETGEIHAKGVKYEIPIVDNIIRMKDAPTEIQLLKVNEDGVLLKDAVFTILNAEGSTVVAMTDTKIPSTEHEGNIQAGESLVFESNDSAAGILITGQLTAGTAYFLKELTSPNGYIAGENIEFRVPYLNTEKPITITAKNMQTEGSFSKENFAGSELPGAQCILKKINSDLSTTVIESWISTSQPKKIIGSLSIDTVYRYEEGMAPTGYLYSETVEFSVDHSGKITEAHYINKDSIPVLYDRDGYPTSIFLTADGTYMDGDQKIIINENGDAIDEDGKVHAVGVKYQLPITDNTVKMMDAPTKALILKTDLDGIPLAGGRFQIIDKAGKAVIAKTDTKIKSVLHAGFIRVGEELIFEAEEGGVDITAQLNAGNEYQLQEISAPSGFHVGESITFHIPYLNTGVPIVVTMKDAPSVVHFSKSDWTDSEEIPGATCVLKDAEGNIVLDQNGDECKWVSTSEPKIFTGILEPGKKYYYMEEIAPDGYGYSEEVSFVVESTGTIQKVEMKDKPTDILITKYSLSNQNDAATPEPLAGAKLQILHSDGYPVIAIRNSKINEDGIIQFKKGDPLIFISELNGTNITGLLNADTDYILREVDVPDGYHKAPDVHFKMNHDGALIKVSMYDSPTKAVLVKLDGEGNPLSGADLEIRDPVNWDVLDFWTSDGKPHDVTGKLAIGKEYLLIEASSPDGYYKADPVPFKLQDSDKVTEVSMTDEPVTVKLIKVRKGTEERLSGGIFTVLSKKDLSVVVPEFKLDGEITITGTLKAGETYLFHEVQPPEGYLKSGDVEFTIPILKPDHILEIVMENHKKGNGDGGGDSSNPPSITFKKYDGITMKALPGAEFTIYDSKGNIYTKVVIGESGYANVSFSVAGTYSYKETKAPSGYIPDPKNHSFEVKSGSIMEYVPNYTTPPEVVITKKDGITGKVIPDVRFVITDEEGIIVYKGTTDIYGQIYFTPAKYGAYAVTESEVPNDYIISDGYITFTVSPAGIEGETIFYNYKKDIPDLPDNPGKKVGIVKASYDNGAGAYGKGWLDRDGIWHPFAHPSKTGDAYPFMALMILAAAGIAGLLIVKRGDKKDE